MRNRTLWRILCVIFGLLSVLALVAQFMLGPTVKNSTITRSYEYVGQSATDLPTDAPDTLEVDGQPYIRVPDEEIEPVVNVVEEVREVEETVNLTGLTSQQAPETRDFTIDGKTVTLVLKSADYTPVEKQFDATSQVDYPNQVNEPEVPATADVTYENEAGEKITVPGQLVEVVRVNGEGQSSFTVPSTISLPEGSSAFIVNGRAVAYDPSTPCWDGYQKDVIAEAKLGAGVKVTGGAWDGAPYYEGGVMHRDIVWYVTRPSSNWVATYRANGTTTVYNAVAVYGGDADALGLTESTSPSVKSEYNLSTEIAYRLDKVVNGNPVVKLMSSNALIVPVVAVIAFVLFLVSLFGLIFLSKTNRSKFEQDEEYEELDYGEYDGDYVDADFHHV